MFKVCDLILRVDRKKFWSFVFVHERRNRKSSPHITVLDDAQAQVPVDIANLFSRFFGSVFTTPSEQGRDFVAYATVTDQISPVVSEDEVRRLIHDLDVRKGGGPDRWPPQFFKSTVTAIVKPLALIFRSCLSGHQYPQPWKNAVVIPVFKADV